MLLQVASRLLFAPSPNRLGAVTCARNTAGGYHQGRLDPRRQALGSVPRQVPPRHCASQSSVFARPPWPSILSLVPLFSPHFDFTLFGFLARLYLRNAHCPLQVSSKQKKLELPPTPPVEPARAPVTCSFIPLRLLSLPFPFALPSISDFIPSTHRRLGYPRYTAHTTLSNHSTCPHHQSCLRTATPTMTCLWHDPTATTVSDPPTLFTCHFVTSFAYYVAIVHHHLPRVLPFMLLTDVDGFVKSQPPRFQRPKTRLWTSPLPNQSPLPQASQSAMAQSMMIQWT